MKKQILVTRSSMPSFDEYANEIKAIWDNRWLTNMGPKHKQLCDALKHYLSVENIDLMTNGHAALEVALSTLKLKGEVIVTPYTFVSTVASIVRCGLIPVFCDVKESDFTIDENKIESLINDKTSAIMAVHVYGNMCNVEAIEKIAKKHNLKVIYDAAHAFGVRYKGLGSASFGDISCFSFHATKVYHTIEGGACCFKDSSLSDQIFKMKDFGIKSAEEIDLIGFNAKMNEFCAAMGLCNLRHVDEEIAKRKLVSDRYDHLLSKIEGIRVNVPNNNIKRNYSYYPIIIDSKKYNHSRDELYEYLMANDVFARKYFYPAINNCEAYKDFKHGDTPVSDYLSTHVLTLPMFADLSLEDVNYICGLIKDFSNK